MPLASAKGIRRLALPFGEEVPVAVLDARLLCDLSKRRQVPVHQAPYVGLTGPKAGRAVVSTLGTRRASPRPSATRFMAPPCISALQVAPRPPQAVGVKPGSLERMR